MTNGAAVSTDAFACRVRSPYGGWTGAAAVHNQASLPAPTGAEPAGAVDRRKSKAWYFRLQHRGYATGHE